MNTTEHLVSCLGEEAAEIGHDAATIQDALLIASQLVKAGTAITQLTSKANRFGLDDRNTVNPTGPTNRERLVAEMNDLLGVAQLCVEYGLIPANWQNPIAQIGKKQRVRAFMDYARRVGALTDEVAK